MAEKPRPFRPHIILAVSFALVVLLMVASLALVIAWSCGCDIRGIEVWTYFLTGSFTFLIGIVIGGNIRTGESPDSR
ncbi:hypothetical protein ES705_46103 [subsurface metagenome]